MQAFTCAFFSCVMLYLTTIIIDVFTLLHCSYERCPIVTSVCSLALAWILTMFALFISTAVEVVFRQVIQNGQAYFNPSYRLVKLSIQSNSIEPQRKVAHMTGIKYNLLYKTQYIHPQFFTFLITFSCKIDIIYMLISHSRILFL